MFLQVCEGSSSTWLYMDSGCSKHMTENTKNILSLKALHGGDFSFGKKRIRYILGIGKFGKSLEDSIEMRTILSKKGDFDCQKKKTCMRQNYNNSWR